MKLEAVRVQGYRSADDVTLSEVGNFNVFIGKNNSGKSTLLFAIQAFFNCIAGGSVVTTAPTVGKRIDFSASCPDGPIGITLTFSLQLAERDALMRDIASEAPQLKNAIDGLDPSLGLEVRIVVPKTPLRHSYVETMSLVDRTSRSPRILLKVSPQAAEELVTKLQTSQEAKQLSAEIKRLLDSIDEDDFRRMSLREVPDSRNIANYFLRRFDPSSLTTRIFETALRNSSSFAEFRNNLNTGRDKSLVEAQQSIQTSLKNKVETFSGDQNLVPQYAINFLTRLAEINVLYLTEQRAPVGRAEAEKLLSFKVKRGGNESLRNIQQTVDGLLGVQVDAFESTTAGEKSAEMDVDNFLLEVNGSGIKESLRLILDVEFQHPSILLVEEPEVHLHPALETNMMRYLKRVSRNCHLHLNPLD